MIIVCDAWFIIMKPKIKVRKLHSHVLKESNSRRWNLGNIFGGHTFMLEFWW